VIDAGCGPGQWTNFLTELGLAAHGVDLVSAHRVPQGPVVERFDHAVIPAYRWPVDDLSKELLAVGFDVVRGR
jgi:hypothetical protein